MKRTVYCIFLLVLTSQLQAQQLIGSNYKQVKKHMLDFMHSNRYTKFTIEEKPAAITFKLREDTIQDVDYQYEFDPKGKCFATGTFAECLQCVENALNAALSYKKYGWTQLNDSTWISSYRHSLQMILRKQTVKGAIHSLDIRKMLWSRIWYADKLAGKK